MVSLSFVAVPLALAEAIVCFILQRSLRTPAHTLSSSVPSREISIPLVNWPRLTALQRAHGDPETAAQLRRDEEERWFSDLLADALGGHEKIPEMFSELVGGLHGEGRATQKPVATRTALRTAAVRARTEAREMGEEDEELDATEEEFYARVR